MKSLFFWGGGWRIRWKGDGNAHMRQLCYHPAPICPSTDSILQLDIIPSTQTSGRRNRRGGEEAEVGRRTKQKKRCRVEAFAARLSHGWGGRKWRHSELGRECDEIQGGGAGALQGTTLWTPTAPPGRRAGCLWILRASTAEGWEGPTFALVAGDVWALPTGVHLQHVQCYITPDALQGRSELPPHTLTFTLSKWPKQAGPSSPRCWRVMMDDSRPSGDAVCYFYIERFEQE